MDFICRIYGLLANILGTLASIWQCHVHEFALIMRVFKLNHNHLLCWQFLAVLPKQQLVEDCRNSINFKVLEDKFMIVTFYTVLVFTRQKSSIVLSAIGKTSRLVQHVGKICI